MNRYHLSFISKLSKLTACLPTRPGFFLWLLIPLLATTAGTVGSRTDDAATASVTVSSSDCKNIPPLPLPSTLKQAAFQNYDVTLYDFVNCGKYLAWARDKGVRDTGPYVFGSYYGTHPAVRLFYSPQIITWLKNGKKGTIPDGAMIIKEQYNPTPAARYANMSEAELAKAFAAGGKDWTIMVRDAKGSKDGWYWAEVYAGMSTDASTAYQAPFNYPNGGFGQYCLRCHASAKNEHTFADLKNIKGFPGDPLTFYSDNSWRTASATTSATTPATSASEPQRTTHGHTIKYRPNQLVSLPATSATSDASFQETFPWIKPVPANSVSMMVPETLDRTVASPAKPGFVTSDQCLSCHGGLSGANPVMFLSTVPLPSKGIGANVSPYGEWRWSPMGLAGRDPIFYAQLESELAYINSLPEKKTAQSLQDTTVNTCFRCHGVLGKRQFDTDNQCDPTNPVKPCNPANPKLPQFQPGFTQISQSDNPHFKYGALARDGISCLACHQQQPTQQPPGSHENELSYFLKNSITGLFQTGPKDKLIGPFKDVATLPMKQSVGIKPEQNDYIKTSRVCGSCHSIYLPVIDKPPIAPVGPKTEFDMEQATYLEWLNSKYQNEFNPVAACSSTTGNGTAKPPQACAQTCQNCHMQGGYHNKEQKLDVAQIQTKIAAVQDQDFPAAEGLAPAKEINIQYRSQGYARHELLGSNIFLLEMVKQFNNVFGVRTSDYMTGKTDGIQQTINNYAQQAQERTAKVETNVVSADNGKLVADVKVTNLAGHRLPSGVGFRRAFIEFLVIDNSPGQRTPQVLWASGRSNDLGVILDGNGKPLASEFFEDYIDKNGKPQQHYQPHYQTIDAQDQVQIYEELVQNAEGRFTTSFLRRDHLPKDNRLLPAGWTKAGPDPKNFNGVYLAATFPKGGAAQDPDYQNGSGGDTVRYNVSLPAGVDVKNLVVRATLYYQSIPPYYLAMRFKEVPNGAATQRLYYLTSNLDLSKSPAKAWKIRIAGAEQGVGQK